MIRVGDPSIVFGLVSRPKTIWGLPYGAKVIRINSSQKSFATAEIELENGDRQTWLLSDYGWAFWKLKYRQS